MNRHTVPGRVAASVGAVVALAGLLSGCAPSADETARRPASSQTRHTTPSAKPTHDAPPTGLPTDSATPSPAATPPGPPPPAPILTPVPLGTVVAEGNVASPKGSIHFHYRMVSNGDNTYSAEYSGFTSTVPVPVSVTLIDVPPRVGDGLTYHGIGDHPLGAPTTSPAAPSSASLGIKPSFLTTLVTYSAAASADGVPVELGPDKVLAVTSIHWSIPVRQTNVHPVDGGTRSNAAGAVSATTPSGAPAGYVVAPGDTTGRVAERFGISVPDLLWLNQGASVFDKNQNLYQGTTLNLDPESL
jgi:LysM repeat protein